MLEVWIVKRTGFLLVIFFLFALGGCKKENAAPRNIVVKAQVSYDRQGQLLQRTYEHPDKLRNLLMCLRLQEFRGRPETDPEKLVGDSCKIRLTYCDGTQTVIVERANRFRCRNFGFWEEIEEEDSLYPLLLAMPGDISQT